MKAQVIRIMYDLDLTREDVERIQAKLIAEPGFLWQSRFSEALELRGFKTRVMNTVYDFDRWLERKCGSADRYPIMIVTELDQGDSVHDYSPRIEDAFQAMLEGRP